MSANSGPFAKQRGRRLYGNLQSHRRPTTEASDTIKDVTDPSVRDIALIGAAQQVEHHEIAVYGTLRRWAEIIGRSSDVPFSKASKGKKKKPTSYLTESPERRTCRRRRDPQAPSPCFKWVPGFL